MYSKTMMMAVTTLGLAGATCFAEGRPSTARNTRASGHTGLVIVVGGVGGLDVVGTSAQWALPRAGVTHEIFDYVWTHRWGSVLRDLQDNRHVEKKAEELAVFIFQRKLAQSDKPIYVVGKSGGAGLVLRAAEQLPDQTLERIILLSPAVAPTYDLRPALRATRRELVSYYSPLDHVILGWGTSQFGTIDRHYGPSAGLKRFQQPPMMSAADRMLYDRLIQIPWRPNMIWQGNLGGHLGNSLPGFVGQELAPWLKQ